GGAGEGKKTLADGAVEARALGVGEAGENRREDRQGRLQNRLCRNEQADRGQACLGPGPERGEGPKSGPQRAITTTAITAGSLPTPRPLPESGTEQCALTGWSCRNSAI